MIKKCTCKHKGQDDLHGEGNRVHNEVRGRGAAGSAVYRCTVCLKEKA